MTLKIGGNVAIRGQEVAEGGGVHPGTACKIEMPLGGLPGVECGAGGGVGTSMGAAGLALRWEKEKVILSGKRR